MVCLFDPADPRRKYIQGAFELIFCTISVLVIWAQNNIISRRVDSFPMVNNLAREWSSMEKYFVSKIWNFLVI